MIGQPVRYDEQTEYEDALAAQEDYFEQHPEDRPQPVAGSLIKGYWLGSHRADPRAVALYHRHYSYRPYADGRNPRQFVAPGENMVLLTQPCDALFVWHRVTVERMDHQMGVNCAVFRNEGSTRSSLLIEEACELAWDRWPGERLFTYVAPAKIRSSNPGYCFQMAGFRKCGMNKDGRLVLLERIP